MKFLSLFLILLVTACSTARTPIDQSTVIQQDRILGFDQPTDQHTSIIKVIRDEGFTFSGCFFAIGLNKKVAALIDVGEEATFYIPPGEFTIKIGQDIEDGFLCSPGGREWSAPISAKISPGETKYFRVGVGIDPMVHIPFIGILVESRGMYIEPYDSPVKWKKVVHVDDYGDNY
jgi:hypothetical protein